LRAIAWCHAIAAGSVLERHALDARLPHSLVDKLDNILGLLVSMRNKRDNNC
jgi:hypothetical protein